MRFFIRSFFSRWWERTGLLRTRLDLWSTRVQMDQAMRDYGAETDPRLKEAILLLMAAQEKSEASIVRTIEAYLNVRRRQRT